MRRSLVVVLTIVGLALGTAACSSAGRASAGPTTNAGGCTSSSAQHLRSGTLTIKDFAYEPDCFAVPVGSEIKVTNEDGAPHTFTVDGTNVDVELDGGRSATADLSGLEPGTYGFHCIIHPSMTGTLIVS